MNCDFRCLQSKTPVLCHLTPGFLISAVNTSSSRVMNTPPTWTKLPSRSLGGWLIVIDLSQSMVYINLIYRYMNVWYSRSAVTKANATPYLDFVYMPWHVCLKRKCPDAGTNVKKNHANWESTFQFALVYTCIHSCTACTHTYAYTHYLCIDSHMLYVKHIINIIFYMFACIYKHKPTFTKLPFKTIQPGVYDSIYRQMFFLCWDLESKEVLRTNNSAFSCNLCFPSFTPSSHPV